VRRGPVALAALAAALPAAAYVLPAAGVLKRMAQKREEAALSALEVKGVLSFHGEAAPRAAAAGLAAAASGEAAAPAFLILKLPGRCRLEAALPDAPPADRPAAVLRAGQVSGHRALEKVPAALALVQAVCALLGERPGGAEPERRYVQIFQSLGVSLGETSLARQGGRVAYLLGGRARDERPLAWIDKQTFQPLRLAATLAGARHDVRFVDWGSATGGDLFPRAVEVFAGGQLRARFVTEKAVANPKVSDAIF